MDQNNKGMRFFLAAVILGLSIILIFFFVSSNLIAQTQDSELQKQMELFTEALNLVREYYVDEDKITPENLIQGAMKGMMEALGDPHSSYLTSTDMSEMDETTIGKFGGAGLYILDADNGIEIARPIEGTPAFRAGINAGDLIIAVDDISVVDMDLDDVIQLIKGEPGTKVKFAILRGKTNQLDFTITRAMIDIPTIKKAMMPDGKAYLKIYEFSPLTVEQVKEALIYFKDKNYKALIIDMRSNPGGVLNSVVSIADYFFPYGKLILYTKSRIKSENKQFKAKGTQIVPQDLPIIVLTDKYSASASEILTGVLKDYKRATIIGEKTYGKGSVQSVYPIGEGGIKFTISKYYTPSGVSIHGIGIEPDVVVQEDDLTDNEKTAVDSLFESNRIRTFVESHDKITDELINGFIATLQKEGILLRERFIKRLINTEMNRTNNNPPVYDLDYDLALQKAVEVLNNTK